MDDFNIFLRLNYPLKFVMIGLKSVRAKFTGAYFSFLNNFYAPMHIGAGNSNPHRVKATNFCP